VKIEHALAAGRAVGEMGFKALIVEALIEALIIEALIIEALIIVSLINWLIRNALMLVTLGRIRSRTGSSIPVVFNLSTAQMLRLFSHWSHISLI
jgi:hypothetical protein